MPRLKINTPDGKTIRVNVSEDAGPDDFDRISEEVLADYEASKVETPGTIESGARGLMSGIPGVTAAVSGIQAIGDKTYEETRRINKIASDKAWEEHPFAYGAGKATGLVGTAVAAPASIPGAVAIGAGAGLDVAAKPEEFLKETAKGAAFGGAFGAAGKHIVTPAIKTVINKFAPAVSKRAVAAVGEPTTKQVESYLKNPEIIRKGLTNEGLAKRVADVSTDLRKASGQLSAGARKVLSAERSPLSVPLPKLPSKPTGLVTSGGREIMTDLTRDKTIVPDTLSPIFDNIKARYLQQGVPKSAAAESAIKALNAQFNRLKAIAQTTGGKLDEVTLQEQIVALQQMTKKAFNDDVIVSTSKDALKNLSGALNNVLKQSNLGYKQAMIPSAKTAALSSKLENTFKIEKGQPTDATVRQMSGILKEPKIEERDLINQIKDMTGDDIAKLITESQTKGAFDAPGVGPALKVLATGLGFGMGKISGIPFGGIGGAAVGRFSSEGIHGGNVAKRILDAYLSGSAKFSNSAMGQILAKYGPVLVNAAKTGGNQLAATHFVLGTSDPQYQELEDEVMGE